MKFYYFLWVPDSFSCLSYLSYLLLWEPETPYFTFLLLFTIKSHIHLLFENFPNFPGQLIAYSFGLQQQLVHTFSTALLTLFFIFVSFPLLVCDSRGRLAMCLIYFELFPVCPASFYTNVCVCIESPENHIALESFYGIWCYQVWYILNYPEHNPIPHWVSSRKPWFLITKFFLKCGF